MEWFITVVGWTGAFLLTTAYGLVSFRRVRPTARLFHLLNIAGSAGIALNSYWNGALPSVALNLLWMVIGLRALAGPDQPGP